MKLIYTNDGLFGWNLNDKIIWCDTRTELNKIGWAHVAKMYAINDMTHDDFVKEIDYALNDMARTNTTIAHFGVMGTFMFSVKEEEASGF